MTYLRKTVRVFLAPILILAFAGLAAAQTCEVPPPGMVAWWPGDGNANDIAGTNHGALNGDATASVQGQVGQAFNFPGGALDYVRVPNHASLEPAAVTVDAWVRGNAPIGSSRYIVAKGASGGTAASYAFYTSGGGLAFYIFNGSGYELSPNAGDGVWDGNWHHIAGTYDAEVVRLYVDGGEIGTGTATTIGIGYSLPTDNDLIIGQYTGTISLPFKGEVDEVEVFGRALKLGEISGIYAAGDIGKCKLKVNIDIKPGNSLNTINQGSAGVIPVAILSSSTFTATNVDPLTIDLNGATVKLIGKKGLPFCNPKDVNGDGLDDLYCQVYTYDFLVEPGATNAVLKAKAYDPNTSLWVWVYGEDSVNIVPNIVP